MSATVGFMVGLLLQAAPQTATALAPTEPPPTGVFNQDLSWSPDGLRISFSCNEGGNFDVHTMALDGARRLRLTNDRASQRYGAWSPDGKRIAFIAGKYPTSEIYLIDSNGSKAKRLTAR